MAFELPTSWSENPRELHQIKTPVFPIPLGDKIYFTEMGSADISTRAARLSNNVNSAATMTFAVNQEVFEDQKLYEIFTKTILGGYCPTLGVKVTPLLHPYLAYTPGDDATRRSGLYAKDLVEVTPMEFNSTKPGKVWSEYNFCKVTINFETLDYAVGQPYSAGDQYNKNFCSVKINTTSNRVSSPLGFYKFADGDFSFFPAMYGTWTTMPMAQIQMTFYHCTRAMVYGPGDDERLIKPRMSDFLGSVNQAAFAGYAAEAVLFDSAEFQTYRDILGTELLNVRYNLIGLSGIEPRNWTFNRGLDPGGTCRPVVFFVGGSKPFQTFNMPSIMTLVNPLNSV